MLEFSTLPNLVLDMLDALHQPFLAFMQAPREWAYLLLGILITYAMGAGGFALARLGLSPLWVLSLLVPFLNLAAIYRLAFMRWPREKTE